MRGGASTCLADYGRSFSRICTYSGGDWWPVDLTLDTPVALCTLAPCNVDVELQILRLGPPKNPTVSIPRFEDGC